MNIFGIIHLSGVTLLMFSVLIITAFGYLLGRITIKGISLGTAGAFVLALLFGIFFYPNLSSSITQAHTDGTLIDISTNMLKTVETIGLIFFVTSVGFISGPTFFKNLKKNYKSYLLLSLVIVSTGGLTCVICYLIGRGNTSDTKEFVAILVGLLSGSLTSTPAFSAAKATVAPEYESAVVTGYGIAYLFGVIGAVLFVQMIPRLLKADMTAERAKLNFPEPVSDPETEKKRLRADRFGIMPFALAAALGIIIGAIKIPLSAEGLSGPCFSLTTTGGTLIAALVFGHFGHLGPISLKIDTKVLEVFRELGLLFFLIGAGIAGGAKFILYFQPIYFVYGVFMSIVPMIAGYLFATYVLKFSLLNALGSITGGRTSTPALGTLISISKTDKIVASYAATYPISLVAVVLVIQLLIILL